MEFLSDENFLFCTFLSSALPPSRLLVDVDVEGDADVDLVGGVGKWDWHCGYTHWAARERKSLPQTMEDV